MNINLAHTLSLPMIPFWCEIGVCSTIITDLFSFGGKKAATLLSIFVAPNGYIPIERVVLLCVSKNSMTNEANLLAWQISFSSVISFIHYCLYKAFKCSDDETVWLQFVLCWRRCGIYFNRTYTLCTMSLNVFFLIKIRRNDDSFIVAFHYLCVIQLCALTNLICAANCRMFSYRPSGCKRQ